ncbi:unnamed protein product [Amoebophrya sp. A25]|nr:unnamed protein product [Amoebophrya sp. A25]|eukprot:GSA25T00018685001.1
MASVVKSSTVLSRLWGDTSELLELVPHGTFFPGAQDIKSGLVATGGRLRSGSSRLEDVFEAERDSRSAGPKSSSTRSSFLAISRASSRKNRRRCAADESVDILGASRNDGGAREHQNTYIEIFSALGATTVASNKSSSYSTFRSSASSSFFHLPHEDRAQLRQRPRRRRSGVPTPSLSKSRVVECVPTATSSSTTSREKKQKLVLPSSFCCLVDTSADGNHGDGWKCCDAVERGFGECIFRVPWTVIPIFGKYQVDDLCNEAQGFNKCSTHGYGGLKKCPGAAVSQMLMQEAKNNG